MPANNSRSRGNYTVGYARPPIATRFQPGRSGNPKGRPRHVRPEPAKPPKGLTPIQEAVWQCLQRPLDDKANTWVPTTYLEHIIAQFAEQAKNGNVRCLLPILKIYGEIQIVAESASDEERSEFLKFVVEGLVRAKHAGLEPRKAFADFVGHMKSKEGSGQ